MVYVLIIQFWVGIVQLLVALAFSVYQGYRFGTLSKTLKDYWLMVCFYAVGAFLFSQINDTLGKIWFSLAWGIAIYWFIHVRRWFKKPMEEL